MKNIFRIFSIIMLLAPVMGSGALAADDPFMPDNYAIVDSADTDIIADGVSINMDAGTANVSTFDIAGIMLGMTFDDVFDLFMSGGGLYVPRRSNSIIYTMHPDWKYNLDYECRQQGTVIPSELEKCINGLARSRGLLYASELHLMRDSTGEEIVVYFTSNATDNRVWRVMYTNDVDDVEGTAEKFENQRQKKILSFWQSVLDKYGAPNSGTDKWATSGNAYDPMMTAYYGGLELVDRGRQASDAAKNVSQSRENFQTKPYAF